MLWAYNATPGDKSRVDLYVGTGVRNATLYCLTSTPDTIIEKRYLALDSSIVHLPFAYKEAYGDGATFTVILYSDGEVESEHFKVERPLPDKRLLMRWSSFRDRLKPGQKRRMAPSCDASGRSAGAEFCFGDALRRFARRYFLF